MRKQLSDRLDTLGARKREQIPQVWPSSYDADLAAIEQLQDLRQLPAEEDCHGPPEDSQGTSSVLEDTQATRSEGPTQVAGSEGLTQGTARSEGLDVEV